MHSKDEVIQWMLKLEMYAKEQKLPLRIFDELGDCKAHLEAEDLSWQELRQKIEEVLESIGQKEERSKKAVQNRESGGLSVQKVQEQVRKMAKECHGENQDSVTGIGERIKQNVSECCRKMNEISHTKAHQEELMDENRYLDFFQKISYEYEKDAAKTVHELFADISGNYSHMIGHMRSMFQNINGHADGIGNEKFYREYETRKNGLEQNIEAEVQTADFGSSAVMEFARKTKEDIKQIIKKLKPKKRILSILPLVILLAVMIGKSVVEYQNADDYEIFRKILEFILNLLNTSTLIIYIFVILLIIVAYTAYIKFLGKWYRSQVCSSCESYLKKELAEFQQENLLRKKTDESIMYLVKEYERQYLDILNHIFEGTKYEDEKTDDALSYERLSKEWALLK